MGNDDQSVDEVYLAFAFGIVVGAAITVILL